MLEAPAASEDAPTPDSLRSLQSAVMIIQSDSQAPVKLPSMQDVAIAYGYNNMQREIPATSTFGKELPLMQLTEGLRSEIKDYTESLTWALCSRAENFGFMNQPEDGKSAVSIGNPATAEFEVCRTTLLPGSRPLHLRMDSHWSYDSSMRCCSAKQKRGDLL